jgi:hypothetical protein
VLGLQRVVVDAERELLEVLRYGDSKDSKWAKGIGGVRG